MSGSYRLAKTCLQAVGLLRAESKLLSRWRNGSQIKSVVIVRSHRSLEFRRCNLYSTCLISRLTSVAYEDNCLLQYDAVYFGRRGALTFEFIHLQGIEREGLL